MHVAPFRGSVPETPVLPDTFVCHITFPGLVAASAVLGATKDSDPASRQATVRAAKTRMVDNNDLFNFSSFSSWMYGPPDLRILLLDEVGFDSGRAGEASPIGLYLDDIG